MAYWIIENLESAVILGAYQGETVREVLEACARDAGYVSAREAGLLGDEIVVHRPDECETPDADAALRWALVRDGEML